MRSKSALVTFTPASISKYNAVSKSPWWARVAAAKSTLLNLIAGFLAPDAGDIHWNDQSLIALPPHQRPVTTLFQDNNLFAHLDVATNIALGLEPSGHLSREQESRLSNMLACVGLGGFEHRLPPSLSGGQQQRVALVRCLLRPQPLLLFDEPFSALDDETRQRSIALVDKSIADNQSTILMITHDRNDAAALNARIVNCIDGRLSNEWPG